MLNEALTFKGNYGSCRTIHGKLGFSIVSSLHCRTFQGAVGRSRGPTQTDLFLNWRKNSGEEQVCFCRKEPLQSLLPGIMRHLIFSTWKEDSKFLFCQASLSSAALPESDCTQPPPFYSGKSRQSWRQTPFCPPSSDLHFWKPLAFKVNKSCPGTN